MDRVETVVVWLMVIAAVAVLQATAVRFGHPESVWLWCDMVGAC